MSVDKKENVTTITASKRFFVLPNLWELRGLGYLMRVVMISEIKARYRQTLVGPAWYIIQILVTTAVFSLIFGEFLKVPSSDIPYPVFVLSGLIIWGWFSQFVVETTNCLVKSGKMLSRVYVPRMVIPARALGAVSIEFAIKLVILFAVAVYFGVVPGWNVLFMPVFLFLGMLFGLSLGLWLSVINSTYRDVSVMIGSAMSLLFWMTPVIYPATVVGEDLSWLFSLNPIVPVIEGFRWSIAGTPPPDIFSVLLSVVIVLVLLIPGAMFFNYWADTIVDRI